MSKILFDTACSTVVSFGTYHERKTFTTGRSYHD
jgi:hypothetical protein